MSDEPTSSPVRRSAAAGARAQFWRRVAGIAGLGLLLRLLAVFTIPTQPVSDFAEYFHRAERIARGEGYDVKAGVPDADHPPAYPLLLAGLISLGPAHLAAAKLGNCLLGFLTIFIGAGLARDLWGDQAGAGTALLFSFYPRLLLMPLLMASENLFSPLVLALMWVVSRRWRGEHPARLAALTGLLIGLAALTRTVGYFLAVVWLVGMVFARVRVRTIAAELALILAVQHLVMLPWAIRNERALGRFTFWNTIGGQCLYVANSRRATGDWYPWKKNLERTRPGILSQGSVALDDAAREEALRWIREHPGRAARLYMKRLLLIVKQDTSVAWWAIYATRLAPPGQGSEVLPGPHPAKNHRAAVFGVLRAAAALLVVLGVGGLLVLFRRARQTRSGFDRALAAGFLAAIAYIPLFSAPVAVNGRYRWPSEDLSIPLAALLLTSRRGSAEREQGCEDSDSLSG